MYINNVFAGLFGFLITATSYAMPPVNVIGSCKNESPADINIKMNELDDGAFYKQPNNLCMDQYEVTIDDKKFGYLSCGGGNYIIANGRNIEADVAVNMSVHPGIKPGTIVPNASRWWKINDKKNDYLCVAGPLSQFGKAAAHYQYYILENAFSTETPQAFFFFFDKPNPDE